MKFTLDWLREHLETAASADEIGKALTMVGLEVEAVIDQARSLAGFVVAHVVAAERHPNADRLSVCKVDAGTGEIFNVVCGAPNARTGMKSVFAPVGTYIPGKQITLVKGTIRGEESNGMLCSPAELELSDDHDGIIALPDDAPVGMAYARYAKLDAVVFDVAITPNRGDAAGVRGVARDLAAFGIGTLKDGTVPPVPSPGGKSPIAVALRFAPGEQKICRMFTGRLIRGVSNGPSPDWLQARLRAVGLRPINALVDITNYVSYDRARPLHVFDADKLTGSVFARLGRPGETIEALDGRTYAVDESICVIADEAGALGIGGIMGGEPSGSTDATTNVFIESAWFEPGAIAAAGRRLGIVSDARYRFERGVDPQSQLSGLELGTRMVVELCGGTVFEPAVAGSVSAPGTVIAFPLGEVKRLTGLTVGAKDIATLLSKLGFAVSGAGETLEVAVPSWRPDVTQKADLVEEVMRMVGVDEVPVEPLPRLTHVAPRMLTGLQNRRRIARRALAARGLDEAVTWSFIAHDEAVRFGGGGEPLQLANALASDMTDMRPSLLPGLIAAAQRNQNRGMTELALFEVGQVFLSETPDGQRTYATAIRTGTARFGAGGRHWQARPQPVGVFDAKADLAAMLDALGSDIDKLQLVAEAPAWSHPGRGGRLQLGPKVVLASFGELHPRLVAGYDLTGPVAAFELDLDALPEPRRRPTRTKPALPLSDLMPLSRDFAFVVDKSVAAATILKAARGADKALITEVGVFDLFEGQALGGDKKSVAIAVTIQPRDKTLTDEEIDKISAAVVAAVTKATGGTLRS